MQTYGALNKRYIEPAGAFKRCIKSLGLLLNE